jgi:hypothetical protein
MQLLAACNDRHRIEIRGHVDDVHVIHLIHIADGCRVGYVHDGHLPYLFWAIGRWDLCWWIQRCVFPIDCIVDL